jgi:hypothetical protein
MELVLYEIGDALNKSGGARRFKHQSRLLLFAAGKSQPA